MVFDLIQKPSGTLDILVYLSRKGKSDVTTMIEELGMCTRTFYSAAHRLKSLGLVFEETKVGWPTRVFYQLTYKGEEVVSCLVPLEKIILDSIDAQRQELEKLKSMSKTKENKERMLKLLGKLQEATFDLGEWDETLRLSAKASELGKSLKDERSLSHAHRYAGFVHEKRRDVSEARENLEKSIQISTRLEDWGGVAEDHYILAKTHELSGDLDDAFLHYERSQEFAKKADWKIGEARARLGFGRVLGRKGRIQESLEEIQQAVSEFEELEATYELATAYVDLGATTHFIDQEKGLELFEKAVDIARKTGDVRIIAHGLSNVVVYYLNKGDSKKALENVREAEDIFAKLDEKAPLARVLVLRGCIYQIRRDWVKSEESFEESIRICEQVDAKYHLGDALCHYGEMLLAKGEVERSKPFLLKALRIFENLGNEVRIAKIERDLELVSERSAKSSP
jgi:tetratricopeptide (TPR) repeat protein